MIEQLCNCVVTIETLLLQLYAGACMDLARHPPNHLPQLPVYPESLSLVLPILLPHIRGIADL